MENEVPVVLHAAHKSVFVNGVGGTEQSSKQQARTLSMYVYNLGPRTQGRIEAVFNNVSNPIGWCESAYKKVLEVLTRQEMVEEGDGTVRTVIFAHSHGGKVVKKALSELKGEIEKKYGDIKSQSAITNIRNQTVVITFGAVALISNDCAKLVMNFRPDDDYMARVCHYLGIGTQTGKNTFYRIPKEPKKQHETEPGLLDSSTCFGGSSWGILAKSGSSQSASPASSKGDENNPHYLDKYIECEEMIQYIVKMLGLPVE